MWAFRSRITERKKNHGKKILRIREFECGCKHRMHRRTTAARMLFFCFCFRCTRLIVVELVLSEIDGEVNACNNKWIQCYYCFFIIIIIRCATVHFIVVILVKINRTRFGVHFDHAASTALHWIQKSVYVHIHTASCEYIYYFLFFVRSCQIHSLVGWAADANIYFLCLFSHLLPISHCCDIFSLDFIGLMVETRC